MVLVGVCALEEGGMGDGVYETEVLGAVKDGGFDALGGGHGGGGGL